VRRHRAHRCDGRPRQAESGTAVARPAPMTRFVSGARRNVGRRQQLQPMNP
jgi:hypothetical protein